MPILVVMSTISIILEYDSINTLQMVIIILVIAILFEMILTWGRKLLEIVMATRIDARLSLMVFERLLSLPIDFF